MHKVPARSRCSRNTSQFQACCSVQPGGLLQRGGTMSCKNPIKLGSGPGLTLSPPFCPQVPPSPSGSHDRGRKAAPAAAPTPGLVRADTGGPAGPRRSPFVVPWCHLQTVRTLPHFPPCLSPSLPAPTWAGFHCGIPRSAHPRVC